MDDLQISLDTTGLWDGIKREVSKVAARTRNEGVSMYDVLKIYSSDESLVGDTLQDSIRSIVTTFPDIATEGEWTVTFRVPDFDPENVDPLDEEVQRYLVSRTVAGWFLTRLPDMAQYFANLATECLGRMTTMLRHRKRVKR